MSKLSFKSYQIQKDTFEAKSSLAQHLVESGVDLEKFNQGLQIIQEWGFNPFKSFGKSAATGAGAVLGSALGPAGTALGGMAGGAVGELGSRAVGHAMKGATVQPIQPAYQQAVQAVDALSQMLDAPDVQAVPDAQKLKQNISQVQQSLQGLGNSIAPIDQQRNATLDKNLEAGGGWGAKLRGATGTGKMAQGMRALGDKIKNIPALNKDMGLRRAMAQGMDSLNAWAQQNPKKAAVLNVGSSIAGGVTGAMGAGSLQNAFAGSPQQPQAPQPQSSDPKHIANSSATSTDAGQFLPGGQQGTHTISLGNGHSWVVPHGVDVNDPQAVQQAYQQARQAGIEMTGDTGLRNRAIASNMPEQLPDPNYTWGRGGKAWTAPNQTRAYNPSGGDF